jgi:hypothetical protein
MRFYTFLYSLFSVRRAKWYPGKDNESEYDYLIICRYLNRLKKNQKTCLQLTTRSLSFWSKRGIDVRVEKLFVEVAFCL